MSLLFLMLNIILCIMCLYIALVFCTAGCDIQNWKYERGTFCNIIRNLRDMKNTFSCRRYVPSCGWKFHWTAGTGLYQAVFCLTHSQMLRDGDRHLIGLSHVPTGRRGRSTLHLHSTEAYLHPSTNGNLYKRHRPYTYNPAQPPLEPTWKSAKSDDFVLKLFLHRPSIIKNLRLKRSDLFPFCWELPQVHLAQSAPIS